MVIYVSNGLAMACTVDWMVSGLGARMRRALPAAAENLYGLDCRALTGTRLGERAVPTYVDRRRITTWVGCHATMMAGPPSAVDGHKIKTNGGYAVGQAALDDLSQNILRAGQPLRVACLTGGGSPDPICTAAQQPGVADCKPAGSLYTVCQVAADQRVRLGMR